MTSDRVKEIMEMEKLLKQQGAELEKGEIQPAREVNLGAGSFRVADEGEKDDERRAQLRRQAAAKERGRGLDPWKLWTVIGVTVVSCLLLLWALFSGATPDKYISSPPTSKPLTASELQQLHETGSRDDPCPDPWWLPEECLDERRTKSKTALDHCNQIFADYEYSLDLLKECGIIKPGD